MVRKVISKSKSKRKSKMKHRVSRVKRPTTRRRNKKTRKRYKGGSAETPPVGLTEPGEGLVEDVVEDEDESLPSPNLFDGPRSVDVLREIYGGDPEEINAQLIIYDKKREEVYDILDEPVETRASGKTDDQLYEELVEFQVGTPKYILISGHGRVLDCEERQVTPCFTLLPRGYNLILSTATGEDLIMRGSQPGLATRQINPTYFRMYAGLIPNHIIDFNLVYRDKNNKIMTRRSYGRSHRTSIVADGAGVTVGVVRTIKPESSTDMFGADVGGNKYFENFVSPAMVDISNRFISIADGLTDDEERRREYAELLTRWAASDFEIIPNAKVQEQIRNSVTPGYEGEFDRFTLSQLLKHIENTGKESERDLPKNILGSFCRGGAFNYNIDGLIGHSRIAKGLPRLTPEYFSGNVDYEGAAGLTKQYSLASKTKPQDFWSIYDNLKENLTYFLLLTDITSAFKSVIQKIEVESEEVNENGIFKGINLTVDDVSLIFQMDYCLESRCFESD